jgi:hypothetical protein
MNLMFSWKTLKNQINYSLSKASGNQPKTLLFSWKTVPQNQINSNNLCSASEAE